MNKLYYRVVCVYRNCRAQSAEKMMESYIAFSYTDKSRSPHTVWTDWRCESQQTRKKITFLSFCLMNNACILASYNDLNAIRWCILIESWIRRFKSTERIREYRRERENFLKQTKRMWYTNRVCVWILFAIPHVDRAYFCTGHFYLDSYHLRHEKIVFYDSVRTCLVLSGPAKVGFANI